MATPDYTLNSTTLTDATQREGRYWWRLAFVRRHGLSTATFYAWKAKFGGLDVSQARKLKVLEEENARLKRLLAEAMLDAAVLRDVAANKW